MGVVHGLQKKSYPPVGRSWWHIATEKGTVHEVCVTATLRIKCKSPGSFTDNSCRKSKVMRSRRATEEDVRTDVFNMQEEVDDAIPTTKDEKGVVTFGTNKPKGKNEVRKMIVPSTRSLFQAVQGLVEAIDVIGFVEGDETGRLVRINGFDKGAIKKSIFDV